MRVSLRRNGVLLLMFSVAVIYGLAPTLDRRAGILVSLAFALVNILTSYARSGEPRDRWARYGAYALISVWTYFILFNDQPWDFLFGGGMLDSSAAPLIACSLIMSFNGWLLLEGPRRRFLYVLITLGLQIPIGLFVGSDALQALFTRFAHLLHYVEYYSGSWQAWQFEWMLTYHLPLYILAKNKWGQTPASC